MLSAYDLAPWVVMTFERRSRCPSGQASWSPVNDMPLECAKELSTGHALVVGVLLEARHELRPSADGRQQQATERSLEVGRLGRGSRRPGAVIEWSRANLLTQRERGTR